MSEDFTKKQDSIRTKVRALVAKYPKAATDYRLLIQLYHYHNDGLKNFVPLEVLQGLTQPESITRAFRKLVADGDITVDPLTEAVRVTEQQNFRQYYGGKNKK